jgi:hypothetical protein
LGTKIVTEKDGALIEEDDDLEACSGELLMVLNENDPWNMEAVTEEEVIIEEIVVPPSELSIRYNGFFRSMIEFKDYKVPYHKISEVIMSQLNNGEKLTPSLMNLLITQINYDMRTISTTISIESVRLVVHQLTDQYPDSFESRDEHGCLITKKHEQLITKLINRNHYLNNLNKASKQPDENTGDILVVPVPKTSLKKRRLDNILKQTCDNWAGATIAVEMNDELEVKKKKMQELSEEVLTSEQEAFVFSSMAECFDLIRRFLNSVEGAPAVHDISNEWPYIFNKEVMISHFEKMQSIEMRNFLETFHTKRNDVISYGKYQRNLSARKMLNTAEDKDVLCLKYVAMYLGELKYINRIFTELQVC